MLSETLKKIEEYIDSRQQTGITILDVGCREFRDFLGLQQRKKVFKSYLGIESKTENEIGEKDLFQTFYDSSYMPGKNIFKYHKNLVNGATLSEEEFERVFSFKFGTDIVEYLPKLLADGMKYDMIIFGNVLDHIESGNADYVFDNSLSILEENGAMVVSVWGINSKADIRYKEEGIKNLYTIGRINKMKNVFSGIYCSEGDENDIFLFIGIK